MKRCLLVLLLALSGCTANPPLNFAVPNIQASQAKISAEMLSLTVTLANPNEQAGKIPDWAQLEVPMMWESALSDALNRMALFTDGAHPKVNLVVKVLALDVPSLGGAFTTRTVARYELINRADGDIVYSQDVDVSATVPLSYAYMGGVRMRESVNRSVQSNIGTFLQSLQASGIRR